MGVVNKTTKAFIGMSQHWLDKEDLNYYMCYGGCLKQAVIFSAQGSLSTAFPFSHDSQDY